MSALERVTVPVAALSVLAVDSALRVDEFMRGEHDGIGPLDRNHVPAVEQPNLFRVARDFLKRFSFSLRLRRLLQLEQVGVHDWA